MNSFTFTVIIAALAMVQVLGFAVEKRSTHEITFVKETRQITEQVTVVGEEVLFEVVQQDADTKLVLDYQTKQIVYTNPNKKGYCYIAELDEQLQSMVPLEKIKTLLKESNGEMRFPAETYRMPPYTFRKVDTPKLNKLSGAVCNGLTTMLGEKQVQAQAVEKTTHKPMKAEIGFWEVVLIIIIILL